MKNICWFAILGALLLGGCVPELYVWSSDGQSMTVLSDEGLRIADAQGNLNPSFMEGVHQVAWFPDSKRLLVSKTVQEKTWEELAPQLSTQQIQSIQVAAGDVRDLAMNYDWSKPQNNSWDAFSKVLVQQEISDGHNVAVLGLDAATGVYFRDHADATVKQKIPSARWDELEGLSQPVEFIQIVSVQSSGMTPGAILMHTIHGVNDLRVSPTGKAALVVTDSDNKSMNDLWVVSPDGGRPAVQISDASAQYPDWSPDGTSVVFARAITPDVPSGDLQLGSLRTVTVADSSGDVLQKIEDGSDLAGLIYSSLTRVRCLKDGRIVFATAQVVLPVASGDLPPHVELFYVWPGKQATVSRLLPVAASIQLGGHAEYFEVNPDESFISVPDDTGAVKVVYLPGATVQSFPENPEQNFKLLSVPTWRSPGELTVLVPDGLDRSKLVLWTVSSNAQRTLSGTWPAALLPKPTTRPTAQAPDSGGL
jgi:WD40-like Beta Propeller Repeat